MARAKAATRFADKMLTRDGNSGMGTRYPPGT
jgi:hypothetical protein